MQPARPVAKTAAMLVPVTHPPITQACAHNSTYGGRLASTPLTVSSVLAESKHSGQERKRDEGAAHAHERSQSARSHACLPSHTQQMHVLSMLTFANAVRNTLCLRCFMQATHQSSLPLRPCLQRTAQKHAGLYPEQPEHAGLGYASRCSCQPPESSRTREVAVRMQRILLGLGVGGRRVRQKYPKQNTSQTSDKHAVRVPRDRPTVVVSHCEVTAPCCFAFAK
jgi:hypothetical protein